MTDPGDDLLKMLNLTPVGTVAFKAFEPVVETPRGILGGHLIGQRLEPAY